MAVKEEGPSYSADVTDTFLLVNARIQGSRTLYLLLLCLPYLRKTHILRDVQGCLRTVFITSKALRLNDDFSPDL